MELKARIQALQKRLKSVAVDNALFQQQNELEKRISQAEQKILAKTGSPLSYNQVVLRMNLLEKRLARLEKLGASSPAQIRVVPGSPAMTPDEAAEHVPLQSSSIHGTTGDYYFSGTLAPAVALSDDSSSLPDGHANAAPEEWHTTPRMVRAMKRLCCPSCSAVSRALAAEAGRRPRGVVAEARATRFTRRRAVTRSFGIQGGRQRSLNGAGAAEAQAVAAHQGH
jgi:hypothetical protein